MNHKSILGVILGLVASISAPSLHSSTLVVTNLFDSGSGSLREAITLAEANADASQISFQVGGTIDFGSTLPSITTPISISSNGFGVTFDGTSAGGRAFYVDSGGDLSLTDFSVQNFFEGSSSGGAIRVDGGSLSVFGSTFSDNTGFTGGALRINSGSVLIQNSTFTGNRGLQGGAITTSASTAQISDTQITNNTAIAPDGAPAVAGIGGGVNFQSNSQVTIENSNISNNIGERAGGGLRISSSTVEISNSSINQNEAQILDEDGGGFIIFGNTNVTITDSEINENTSQGNGGGIQAQNTGTSVTLERTTVDGNSALAGGGIRSDQADITVIQSTISNNDATAGAGAGISSVGGGELQIVNSTISGNTSTGGGGGLAVTTGVSGSIASSTIAFNNSGGGGAGLRFSSDGTSTFTTENSIYTDNFNSGTPNSLSGSVQSFGYNLFQDDGGSITSAVGDQFNANADLQALADNGGPTQTHALELLSDAVDTGMTALLTDQRGYLRPAGTMSDIGSYELNAAIPEPSVVMLVSVGGLLVFAGVRRSNRKMAKT